jgi:hypothetical protein
LASTFSNGRKRNPEAGVVSVGHSFSLFPYGQDPSMKGWDMPTPSPQRQNIHCLHASLCFVIKVEPCLLQIRSKNHGEPFQLIFHRFSCLLFWPTNNDELQFISKLSWPTTCKNEYL